MPDCAGLAGRMVRWCSPGAGDAAGRMLRAAVRGSGRAALARDGRL